MVSSMTTYRIVRFYERLDKTARTVKRGLSLEEAERLCALPEANSRTVQSAAGRLRLKRIGHWQDKPVRE
jgi:hypothetical protein